MPIGTGKRDSKAARDDKGTPKQEVKAAKAKSSERPMDSDMGHARKMSEHLKAAEHHHREARKVMAKMEEIHHKKACYHIKFNKGGSMDKMPNGVLRYVRGYLGKKILNTPENRFKLKCSEPNENGCILWKGPLKGHGYGQFSLKWKTGSNVHRYAYEKFYGITLTTEMWICHKCDEPSCVIQSIYLLDRLHQIKRRLH